MNGAVLRSRADFRWRLLTTACAVALCASLPNRAQAGLGDIGQFSLSLSGMWDHPEGDPALWATEHYADKAATDYTAPDGDFEISPRTSWDYGAQAAFEPAGTAWVFSGAFRYGRSRTSRAAVYETFPTHHAGDTSDAVHADADTPTTGSYSGTVSHNESHMFADFSIGRDFGLGLWDGQARSVFSLGARYARFTSHSDIGFKTATEYKTTQGTRRLSSSFDGFGPRIAWDGSAPLLEDLCLFIDAGADGAMLFGRQKASVDASYTGGGYVHTRHKAAIVKNFGGFAALSWKPFNLGAKMSIGYRADLFFHALDGGSAHTHEIDRSFYGPFASIGIETR
ncbi:MAG TPA: Lpg1974 family pore-forming outer membrane protein [Rhizomicrobium sp.]|jgi:hypothetical protein|nr:Lpg1974 family pore-forming outer membrane protein [Rhizomicrobium sp.]